MQRFTGSLNRSHRLGRLISWISGAIANNRGVPILFGIVLVIGSLVLHITAIIVDTKMAFIIATITLHAGLLFSLIGILLAEPLGKG